MAFQVRQTVLLTAFLFLSFDRITKSQATKPSKHGQVHRAKSQIDSLIYKLTLDLKSFNEKETKAEAMQKDASKLAGVAEEEIALLRPVQDQFNIFWKSLQRGTPRMEKNAVWPGQAVKYRYKLKLHPLCLNTSL